MRAKITIDGLDDVNKALKHLRDDELPTAYRNAINDTARDITRRLAREAKSVFDRPKAAAASPFYLHPQDKATKTKLHATIRIKDHYGEWLKHVVTQHTPGYPKARNHKGFERLLMQRGFLKPGQYLVPARTLRKDRFGNPSPGIYANILNDLAAFRGREGFDSTTKATNRKFAWLTLRQGRWQRQGAVTGIWYINRLRKGMLPALVFLAVDKRPTYSARFRVNEVAESYGRKVFPKHMIDAVGYALARRLR